MYYNLELSKITITMASKRSAPFIPCYAHEYAVRVTQRSANAKNGSVVVAAECLFYVYFGWKLKVGSKRKKDRKYQVLVKAISC